MKKYIITAIVTILLTYIAFAFVELDLNSYNWDKELREEVVLLGFFLSVFAIFAQINTKE